MENVKIVTNSKNEAALPYLIESRAKLHVARRDRKLRPLTRSLEKVVAAAFVRQGRRLVRDLAVLKDRIDLNAKFKETAVNGRLTESLTFADWVPYVAAAERAFALGLMKGYRSAVIAAAVTGATDAITASGGSAFGISFNISNPDAVAYAEDTAAARIKNINNTTRMQLRTLISTAVSDGLSWSRLKKQIEGKFAEFATGGKNPRSKRIAVFETGDAYEAGQDLGMKELATNGLRIFKKWVTAGDKLVRPSHRKNGRQGYIPFDEAFSSGDQRPPTDPGCRCTRIFKAKK